MFWGEPWSHLVFWYHHHTRSSPIGSLHSMFDWPPKKTVFQIGKFFSIFDRNEQIFRTIIGTITTYCSPSGIFGGFGILYTFGIRIKKFRRSLNQVIYWFIYLPMRTINNTICTVYGKCRIGRKKQVPINAVKTIEQLNSR